MHVLVKKLIDEEPAAFFKRMSSYLHPLGGIHIGKVEMLNMQTSDMGGVVAVH